MGMVLPHIMYGPYNNTNFYGCIFGAWGFLAQYLYHIGPIYQHPFTPQADFKPHVVNISEIPPIFSWDLRLVIVNWNDVNTFNEGCAVNAPKTSQFTKVLTREAYSKATPPTQKQNFSLDSKGSAQPSEKLQSLAVPMGQP